MNEQELKDMQELITIFFPFAEEQLVKQGSFRPYAGAVTTSGDFVPVARQLRHAQEAAAVADLKHALQQQQQDYRVAAVFYEAEIKDKENGAPSDAVGVFIEHRNGKNAYEFMYPYTPDEMESFILADSFGTAVQKEIFLPGP